MFSLLAVPDVRVWCPVTPFKSQPPQGSGSLYLDGIADIVADSQVGNKGYCRSATLACLTFKCKCLSSNYLMLVVVLTLLFWSAFWIRSGTNAMNCLLSFPFTPCFALLALLFLLLRVISLFPFCPQAWAVLLKDTLGIGSDAWCRARLSAASTDTTVWVDLVPSSARSNVLCGRWAVSSSNAAAPSDVIVRGGSDKNEPVSTHEVMQSVCMKTVRTNY